jgi:hypothetical protein
MDKDVQCRVMTSGILFLGEKRYCAATLGFVDFKARERFKGRLVHRPSFLLLASKGTSTML